MSTATISRWARRFLVVAGLFLIASQVAALGGTPRRVEVVLGLQGFVLTTAFGKAYSLVPSYFDRSLAWPRALGVHLPLAVIGVCCLALGGMQVGPDWLWTAGAGAWALGVAVFVATLIVTVWDNLTGSETGTGDSEAGRKRIDRYANAFVPLALLYLSTGAYELLAGATPLPAAFDGWYPRVAHLLAAGFALLLLFAVGYRLLPRFLSVPTPTRLAGVVLPLGAAGPVLIAWGLPGGPVMSVGAAAEAAAVVGFASTYAVLVSRTDTERVGFYGPLAAVALGVVGVALGVWFALDGSTAALSLAHLRVNVFGLLGLSIVGVVYQFYPPAVGTWPLADNRLALVTIALIAAGVALAAVGAVLSDAVAAVGHVATGLGAFGYVYLLVSAIRR